MMFPYFPTVGKHVLWPSPKEIIGGSLALLSFALLNIYKKERALFVLLLFSLGLLPAISAIMNTGITADRYVYIPMMAFSILIAHAYIGIKMHQRIKIYVPITLLGAYVLQSHRILPQWNTTQALFSHALEQYQTPYRAGAFAKALEEKGKLQEAAYWYEEAIALPYPNIHSCYNITWIQLLQQDIPNLIRVGEKALHVGCPPSAELTAPLALAYAQTGQWEKTLPLLKQAKRDPRKIFYLIALAQAARERNLQSIKALLPKENRDLLIKDAANLLLQGKDHGSAEWLRAQLWQ